jgi:hypothetical protein
MIIEMTDELREKTRPARMAKAISYLSPQWQKAPAEVIDIKMGRLTVFQKEELAHMEKLHGRVLSIESGIDGAIVAVWEVE